MMTAPIAPMEGVASRPGDAVVGGTVARFGGVAVRSGSTAEISRLSPAEISINSPVFALKERVELSDAE
jgi:hypothetical protein